VINWWHFADLRWQFLLIAKKWIFLNQKNQWYYKHSYTPKTIQQNQFVKLLPLDKKQVVGE
jgi:hypothetical protein